MFKIKGLMNCNLVLERTDKYGKSVVNKMENLPDGLYFIEKKKEKFGISKTEEILEVKKPITSTSKTPEKKEVKPNKAKPFIKKITIKKAGKKK